MLKRSTLLRVFTLLIVFGAAGCGSTNSTSTSSTPTAASSPTIVASNTPLTVTSLVTSVTPDTFSGISCGSSASFNFSTVITVSGNSGGGQVTYTWNIGSSHVPGSVTFDPGETSKTVTYTLKNTVQPGTAASVSGSLSVDNNGSTLTSTPASATGICSFPGKFQVVSIGISVSPYSVTGYICSNYINIVYTATITIAPNTNGGNVLLKWSFSSTPVTVTFGPYQPGQTTKTVSYTLPGKIEHNNAFPPFASISSTSPNVVTSARVKPYGPCSR